MKVFLVWLVITTGPDGFEFRMYENKMSNMEICFEAQRKLDKTLLNADVVGFTTLCEER